VTNDGYYTYAYDAEGHTVQAKTEGGATVATYVYNALNQRVQAAVAGSTTTDYVFNAAGQRVSEWNGTTFAQIKGKYYWGGKPVAYYSGGATHFEHQDWLGTERMRTTYNASVEGTFTSLPFGDAQTTPPPGTDGDTNHYATLDYDSESNTDHAQYRQDSNTQGRWLSPDPYSGSYDASNPQSMNRYVYALNNPLSNIDPSGLDFCIYDNGDGTGVAYINLDGGSLDCPGNGFYINTMATSLDGIVMNSNGDVTGYTLGDQQFDTNGSLYSANQTITVNGNTGAVDYTSTWTVGPGGVGPGGPVVAPNDGLPKQNTNIFTRLLTGTNYCGPGGAGTPINRVDAACAAHDLCYQNATVSWVNNFGWPTPAQQQAAIGVCDAALSNALSNISWPTSAEYGQATLVSTYFNFPGYSLRP
jgi:RHS repeat-associated protein